MLKTFSFLFKWGWTYLPLTILSLLGCRWLAHAMIADGESTNTAVKLAFFAGMQPTVFWSGWLGWQAMKNNDAHNQFIVMLYGSFFGWLIGPISTLGWILYGLSKTALWIVRHIKSYARHLTRPRDQFDHHYLQLRKILRVARQEKDPELILEAEAGIAAIERARQEIAVLEAIPPPPTKSVPPSVAKSPRLHARSDEKSRLPAS